MIFTDEGSPSVTGDEDSSDKTRLSVGSTCISSTSLISICFCDSPRMNVTFWTIVEKSSLPAVAGFGWILNKSKILVNFVLRKLSEDN